MVVAEHGDEEVLLKATLKATVLPGMAAFIGYTGLVSFPFSFSFWLGG